MWRSFRGALVFSSYPSRSPAGHWRSPHIPQKGAPRGVRWADQHPHVDTRALGGFLIQHSQRRGSGPILSPQVICGSRLAMTMETVTAMSFHFVHHWRESYKTRIHLVKRPSPNRQPKNYTDVAATIRYEFSLHTKKIRLSWFDLKWELSLPTTDGALPDLLKCSIRTSAAVTGAPMAKLRATLREVTEDF